MNAAAASKEQVRQELTGLKLKELYKKAEELGLPEEEIDAAEDKELMIELLLPALLKPSAAEEALRAELAGLSIRKLSSTGMLT
jgi:hypothetical protein